VLSPKTDELLIAAFDRALKLVSDGDDTTAVYVLKTMGFDRVFEAQLKMPRLAEASSEDQADGRPRLGEGESELSGAPEQTVTLTVKKAAGE